LVKDELLSESWISSVHHFKGLMVYESSSLVSLQVLEESKKSGDWIGPLNMYSEGGDNRD